MEVVGREIGEFLVRRAASFPMIASRVIPEGEEVNRCNPSPRDSQRFLVVAGASLESVLLLRCRCRCWENCGGIGGGLRD